MKKNIVFLILALVLFSASVPAAASEGPEETEGAFDTAEAAAPAEAPGPAADGTYQDTERSIISRIITDGMSDYDKLVAITKYAADNYSYSSYYRASDLITYGSGNCIANTYFILDLCELAGIEAWYRQADADPGSGPTHVCAVARIGNKYYTADSGYNSSKPRSFDVTERPGGFSATGGTIYQYDGRGVADLVVPERMPDSLVVKRSGSYTQSGATVTQIGYSGRECFSYGEGLRSITLPATVQTVTATAFKGCDDLENIYVDPGNPYFTSIDGVLYSKDLTRLVCVPAKKTAIVMPPTVTSQDANAFYGGTIPVVVGTGTLPFEDVGDEWFAESVEFVYRHSLFQGTSGTTFSPNSNMTRGMFITVLGRFAGGGSWSSLERWSGTLGVSSASQVAVRSATTTAGSTVLARIGSPGELVRVLSTVASGRDGAVWYEVQYGSTTGYVRQKDMSGTTLLRAYTGSFADLPDNAWYTGYAQWANIFGVMNGVSETAFEPNADIKREDICVLLYRFLTNYLGRSVTISSSVFTDDGDISDYAREAVYAMRSLGVIQGYPDNSFAPRAGATRAEVASIFRNFYDYLN